MAAAPIEREGSFDNSARISTMTVRGGRFETLDALRGLAALSVVLGHWQWLNCPPGLATPMDFVFETGARSL
jgi:hypothetical protein